MDQQGHAKSPRILKSPDQALKVVALTRGATGERANCPAPSGPHALQAGLSTN
jgi:hypothetical protein